MRGVGRAFVDESRLKFFADEADEAVDLFGGELFLKGGHAAVAAFGDLAGELDVGVLQPVTGFEAGDFEPAAFVEFDRAAFTIRLRATDAGGIVG